MFKRTLTLASFLLFSIPLWAEKINIIAKSFTGEKDKIVYRGNVKLITQSGKKIFCDRLIVFLTKDGKVDKIVAGGNVIYKDGKYTATGNVMIYYPNKKEVVLQGNAVVKTKHGVLQGDKIVYNLKTGAVDVKSQSTVSGVFVIENQ